MTSRILREYIDIVTLTEVDMRTRAERLRDLANHPNTEEPLRQSAIAQLKRMGETPETSKPKPPSVMILDPTRQRGGINPWDIYKLPGWEAVSQRLDHAVQEALAKMDIAIFTNEHPIEYAAQRAFQEVMDVMDSPINKGFGAGDSEPREHLAMLIEDDLRETHNCSAVVDRWGGISITDMPDKIN